MIAMSEAVSGFRVLRDRSVTPNELAWVEMLRAVSGHEVPGPTLKAVQALRAAMDMQKAGERHPSSEV